MAGWVSPSRLISLYEIATLLTMDQFRASTFYLVGRIVENLASKHGLMWRLGEAFYAEPATVPTIDEKISQKDQETISMVLPNITDECRKIGLERATLYAEHVLQQLTDRGDLTNRQIGSLLIELDKHIRWDMEKETFMYVSPDRASYYHNKKLLSPESIASFPSATEEIILAGDCYAVACWTASVMHSMRSLEKPIYSVASAIGGINLSKEIEFSTWGKIHREIDANVQKLRNTAHTAARDEEIAFYSSLNLEFGYFNDVCRKFAAHSRKNYDALQAKSALQHVIAFIDQAAARGLKENP
jgi:hypothetical protein